jgi:hypothetical protein
MVHNDLRVSPVADLPILHSGNRSPSAYIRRLRKAGVWQIAGSRCLSCHVAEVVEQETGIEDFVKTVDF